MIKNLALKHSIIYTLLLLGTFSLFSSCSKTPEEVLKNIAEGAQKTCPQVMDEYTSMISVEAIPDRKLKYTYLVTAELSENEKIMATVEMKKVLLDKLKKQSELEFYQANDVGFEHIFKDKDDQLVILVEIEPIDYK